MSMILSSGRAAPHAPLFWFEHVAVHHLHLKVHEFFPILSQLPEQQHSCQKTYRITEVATPLLLDECLDLLQTFSEPRATHFDGHRALRWRAPKRLCPAHRNRVNEATSDKSINRRNPLPCCYRRPGDGAGRFHGCDSFFLHTTGVHGAPFRRMATCNQTFHARAPEKPLPRARSQSTMAHMPFSLLELAPLPATPFPASLAFQAVPQSPMDSHCNLHELNFMGKAVFKRPLSPTIFIPKLFLRLVWHF